MKIFNPTSILVLVLSILSCFSQSVLATEYSLSKPYTHENLTLRFLQLTDNTHTIPKDAKILTLDEALSQKKVVVHETGDVNQLQVENITTDEVIFIQAGDIVKGGKQDRVTTTDLLLQPKSGKVAMSAFCVEQGRWRSRGSEDVKKFSSSKNRLSSKNLKVAAFSKNQQAEVWKEVSNLQDKLQKKAQSSVQDNRSKTSLQLSLENKAVQGKVENYLKVLTPVVQKHAKANGYVALINGEITSADAFASPALFQKQWSKLLLSTATEALAESAGEVGGQKTTNTPPTTEQILQFLAESEQGELEQQNHHQAGTVVKNDTDTRFFYESRLDTKAKNWIHKGYLKK